jgi:hypothetical protein
VGEDHHGQGERKKIGWYEWFLGEEKKTEKKKNSSNMTGGQL